MFTRTSLPLYHNLTTVATDQHEVGEQQYQTVSPRGSNHQSIRSYSKRNIRSAHQNLITRARPKSHNNTTQQLNRAFNTSTKEMLQTRSAIALYLSEQSHKAANMRYEPPQSIEQQYETHLLQQDKQPRIQGKYRLTKPTAVQAQYLSSLKGLNISKYLSRKL